ncbi:unnamed protein product, partial [Mesorhabditis spiculigera]
MGNKDDRKKRYEIILHRLHFKRQRHLGGAQKGWEIRNSPRWHWDTTSSEAFNVSRSWKRTTQCGRRQ